MGVIWNNPPVVPQTAAVYLGTPVAASGVTTVGTTINGATVPSFPYPTLQQAFGAALLSIGTATDQFDLGIYTQINGGAVNSAPSKQRSYGTSSVGPLVIASKVPAGQQWNWTMQMIRVAGTGTAASFADGNFNSLVVVVTPAV